MSVALACAVYFPAISGSTQPAEGDEPLKITVAPQQVYASVGTPVNLTVTLVNQNSEPTGALAVHIDIIDPKNIGSVDPENWTAELTRSIPGIEPGNQAMVTWSITPLDAGDFMIYAIAVDQIRGFVPSPLSVSWGTPIQVESKRSFNPHGTLPVAIAMPSVFGVILLWRNWALRRKPNDQNQAVEKQRWVN